MKRKKGSKGSFNRLKRNDLLLTSEPNSPSISIEVEKNMDTSSKFEVEVEQSITVDNKLNKSSRTDTDIADFKSSTKIGYSRVKVKLKPSKLVELHDRSSDAVMLSASRDTDTNNSRFVSEVNEISAGNINNTCSDSQVLEASYLVPENPARKPGSIKIKSSRGSDIHHMQIVSEGSHKGSPYNKKELSAALGVIRKIMKMDAAVPFNAPVNPVALGIPDYFDIINTPMDFGSISHDLEHGTKYKNSLDVYKDVQFIWDNCYKYNNKGDYILDLMKRVKKNFMKYWTAAGLLTVGTQVDDVLYPHQEKAASKAKSKQKRRRYGIDGHKSNCLCAVCVVRRRRKEREEHSAAFENHIMVSHISSPNEPKLEVISVDNPCSEGTASSLDRSPEMDADAEMDDAGKLETVTSHERIGSDAPERLETISREIEIYTNAANNETCGNIFHENGNSNQHSYDQECLHSNSSKHSDKKDEDEGEDDDEDERQGEYEDEDEEMQQEEFFSSGREMKSFESPPQQENHSALWLLKELFPEEQNSVWNGPHSLTRRLTTAKQNNNPLRSALETMMNS